MARVEYISPVNNLTGKLGGAVFQKNKSGFIIRSKEYGKKTATQKQNLQRNIFSQIKKLWDTIGTVAQSQWNDFASLHAHYDKYTNVFNLTGFQWFMSINLNTYNTAQIYTLTPPDYLLPNTSPPYTLQLSHNDIILNLTEQVTLDDTNLLIFTTPPILKTSGQVRRYLRLTKVLFAGEYDTISIVNEYKTTHNIEWNFSDYYYNLNVFCQIVPIHNVSYINGISLNISANLFQNITPWYPTSIPNCILWLDADTITVNDGDNVAEWDDQSNQLLQITQSNVTRQPILKKNIINGHNAVQFTSNDKFMQGTYQTAFYGNFSICEVFNQRDYGTTSYEFYIHNSLFYLFIYSYNGRLYIEIDYPGQNHVINCGTFVYDKWYYILITINNNTLDVWLNRSHITTGTCENSSCIDVFLGIGAIGYSWSNYIANKIIYNKALTETEREQLFDYISQRYNFTE